MNIKEVAAKAGVSVTTVSRVLNSPEKVSDSTREKVLSTIEELNYTPNWFARNIQNSRTNIIGVVVPDTLGESNMEMAKGIDRIARNFKCNMILCNTGYELETEREQIESLINRKTDGLILIDSLIEKSDIQKLKDKRIPYVFVEKNEVTEKENLIYTDYEEATEKVIDYLADMGRKKIAIILSTDHSNANDEKLRGFKNALKRNKLVFSKKMLIYSDNSIAGGFVSAEKLLDSESPDAIFVATDTIAFGVLEASRQRGLTPDDIGIIGFDGLEAGAVVEPKLTTVIKPSMRMGLMAGRLLFDLINADDDMKPQQIMLQSKMRIRKSCGNKERIKEIW